MLKNILLIGYGSAGKRHVRNLIKLDLVPHVLTNYPDRSKARFLDNLKKYNGGGIEHCIISSPTARHLDDFKKCIGSLASIKKVLIEKPLECSYAKAKKIKDIAKKNNLEVSVAYNLRFIDAFDLIAKYIKKNKKRIKIVEAVAGQDLRDWRPGKNINKSYSAKRALGGGVDLDLSHEVDYILWLFGNSFKKKFIYRAKISNLNIDSPDIFKMFLDYDNFVVDISLDYIRRPKERYLKMICDNQEDLYYNFVTGTLKIGKKVILKKDGIKQSYEKMLKSFLGSNKQDKSKLCSLEQGLSILKTLGV